MELFVRIVNTRDVDLQSKVRMEPHLHHSMYKYPGLPVTVTIPSQVSYPESVGTLTMPPSRQSHRLSTRPPSEIESAPSTPQAGEGQSRSRYCCLVRSRMTDCLRKNLSVLRVKSLKQLVSRWNELEEYCQGLQC